MPGFWISSLGCGSSCPDPGFPARVVDRHVRILDFQPEPWTVEPGFWNSGQGSGRSSQDSGLPARALDGRGRILEFQPESWTVEPAFRNSKPEPWMVMSGFSICGQRNGSSCRDSGFPAGILDRSSSVRAGILSPCRYWLVTCPLLRLDEWTTLNGVPAYEPPPGDRRIRRDCSFRHSTMPTKARSPSIGLNRRRSWKRLSAPAVQLRPAGNSIRQA